MDLGKEVQFTNERFRPNDPHNGGIGLQMSYTPWTQVYRSLWCDIVRAAHPYFRIDLTNEIWLRWH